MTISITSANFIIQNKRFQNLLVLRNQNTINRIAILGNHWVVRLLTDIIEPIFNLPSRTYSIVSSGASLVRSVFSRFSRQNSSSYLEAARLHWQAPAKVSKDAQEAGPKTALATVTQNGLDLQLVTYESRDSDLSVAAVTQNCFALQYVPVELRNHNLCLFAVTKSYLTLQYVPENVQKEHPEIPLMAVTQNGLALKDVPENVQKEHPEIPLMAVTQNGLALKNVPKNVQKMHPNISLAAIKNKASWEDVALSVLTDRDFIIERLQHKKYCLRYACKSLRDDFNVVYFAVLADGEELHYASTRLKNDSRIVEIAIQQNGLALEYASTQLRNAWKIVEIAIQQNGRALKHASTQLRDNWEIVEKAVFQNINYLRYASERLQSEAPRFQEKRASQRRNAPQFGRLS